MTPVVSGTVMILIAITILPIAFDNIQTLPEGASAGAGPAIAAVTLLASVILTLRATGRWRLIAPFLSIVVGCLVTVAFGEFDVQRIGEASWFGVPDIPDLGFDLTPGKEFWALLPTFAILTLTMGIKSISDSVVIQQASRRRHRAIDFRQVQGMVGANGVGMLLAGIAGTPPTMIYSSFSMTLINLTGVAARRVGIGVAVVFLALAFFSKFAAVLLSIPGPVLAAYLMLAMGLFFVVGVQTIIRGGLDPRRGLIVALSIALGLGLHEHSVIRDLLGDELGALLGNGVMIGAVVAIGMTLLLEAMNSKASRLEVTLDMASLAAIDEFLARLAAQIGWNEASALRLRSASEETLASLLPEDEDEAESSDAPRLIVVARPQRGVVELEFVATTRRENLEDQMTYLTDEAAMPTVNELSLRLLRHYASNVRHQKFHGVDIVTVQVEGSAWQNLQLADLHLTLHLALPTETCPGRPLSSVEHSALWNRRHANRVGGHPTAVDQQGVSGDVAGHVGEQEQHRLGDLVRGTQALEGDQALCGSFHPLGGGRNSRRRNAARRDRIDANVVRRQLDRHAAHQVDQAGLGRAVGRVIGRRLHPFDRGDADDAARRAARDHRAGDQLGVEEEVAQVHPVIAVPLRRRHVGDRIERPLADNRDQQVDAAQFLFGPFEDGRNLHVVQHVGGQRD